MNKRTFFCFAVALVSIATIFTTVAAKQQRRKPAAKRTTTVKPTPAPTPAPNRLSKIDDEANGGCVAEFRKVYSECSGAWLSEIYKCRSGSYVLEFRDVTTVIKKKNLSTADQMNGLEWDGAIILRSKVWRWHFRSDSTTYNQAVSWHDVNDARGEGMDVCLATKRNGAWEYKLKDQGLDNMFGLATCFSRKKVECGIVDINK